MEARVTQQSVSVFALVLLLVLMSLGGAAGAAKAQKITITLREHSFTPVQIAIQAGVLAEIRLTNTGMLKHEFMVYVPPRGKVSDWDEYVIANTYFKDIGEVEAEFEGIGAVAGTRIFEVEVQPARRWS
jgi:hypothetical protein